MTSIMWTLVWSVSAAVLLSSADAACPYNVTACTCTGRSLVCRNVDGIPLPVSDNKDGNITDLTFTSGKLNNISRNSLPANLQNLVFSDVSITSISPDAFSGSATTLKSLTMSKVKYPELPDALVNVNSLTDLKLYDMNITNWKTDVLQNVGKTLRSVVFQNVSLTSWPEWLKSFNLVNSVDLSRNRDLEAISVDAFSKVENLTNLYLRSTGQINETNFNEALNPVINTLQILDISDNVLAFIPQVISSMTKLTKLYISENIITEITANKIPPQLKELDLHRNVYLNLLNDTSFPNGSSLEVLNLGATLIYKISPLAFEPLKQLRQLNLSYSSLTEIPLALTKLTNLQVLKMDSIHLLTCPCPRDDRLVKWYQTFKSLDLSGNCINDKYSIKVYLTNTTGQSPCSGNSRATFNVFLYFFVLLVVGVFLL